MKLRILMFLVVALFSYVSVAANKYWTGAVNNYASNKGNWCDDADLLIVSESAPTTGDDIYLTSGSAAMTWNLNISVGSWTQDGYTGTVTFHTGKLNGVSESNVALYGYGTSTEGRCLKVTGDVVFNTGVWTAPSQVAASTMGTSKDAVTKGYGVYRLIVNVDGDFSMGAEAKIDLKGKGFNKNEGPGATGQNDGGSHGGCGGLFVSSSPKSCYGVVASPITLGSGGKSHNGGGAFTLTCAGAVKIDGIVNVVGASGGYHTGAGGSIFITASSISGAGTLNANGGKSTSTATTSYHTSGGGGRIAIVLTGEGSDFSKFSTAVVQAKLGSKCTTGGKGDGSGGTIYMEKPSDGAGCGILIIDGSADGINSNTSSLTSFNCKTELTSKILNCTPSKIVFRKTGRAILNIAGDYILPEIVQEADTTISGEGYLEIGPSTTAILPNGMVDVPLSLRQKGAKIKLGENCNGVLEIGSGQKLYVDQAVTIDGSVIVKSNGVISHRVTSSPSMNLTINGDLEVESGGNITATGLGTADYGTKAKRGGSYGGRAGKDVDIRSYGSIRCPVDAGSQGEYNGTYYKAGGAIRITATGELILNGTVSSDGSNATHYPGSGGSVWLTAKSISGSGKITANGGNQTKDQIPTSGGGGRIAVWLTGENADFSSFTGSIEAYGGMYSKTTKASAGTIYLKKGNEAENEGTLKIINRKKVGDSGNTTDIVKGASTQVSSKAIKDADVGEVIIENSYVVLQGLEMQVQRGWNTTSTASLTCGSGGNLRVTGTADAYFYGTNTFNSFFCDVPGKKLYFGTGSSHLLGVKSGGSLSLTGSKEQPLLLLPATENTEWLFKVPVTGLAEYTVENVLVDYSNANSGEEVEAKNSNEITEGSCQNWKFATVEVGELNTWTGAENTEWNNSANWCLGRIPVNTDKIVLSASDNNPKLPVSMELSSLEVSEGATLYLNGCNLTVLDSFVAKGSIIFNKSETIELQAADIAIEENALVSKNGIVKITGEKDQSLTINCAINKLTVEKTAGVVQWSGSLQVNTEFSIKALGAFSIAFASDAFVSCDKFSANGVVETEAVLALSGGVISARKYAIAKGVSVSNCNAAGGSSVFADDSCTDAGGNLNWQFGTGKIVWTGAADSNFSNPENWSGGVCPGENDIVEISSAATITVNAPLKVGGLVLGGGGEKVNFTVRDVLKIDDILYVGANATIALDAETSAGEVYVDNGGSITHTRGGTSEKYKINLSVSGDMTVASGGTVTVFGKGYNSGVGKGAGQKLVSGASHGGRGSRIVSTGNVTPPCYGSYLYPVSYGSGGQDTTYGGGAVKLVVAGTLYVDGEINANGNENGASIYVSSGGSIWITCAELAGYGIISANGANGSRDTDDGFLGGGGRIAIYRTTVGDFSNWHGSAVSRGGYFKRSSQVTYKPQASAGTVVWGTIGAQPLVVIDNNGSQAPNTEGADLPISSTNGGDSLKDVKEYDIVVKNGGELNIISDVTVWDVSLETSNASLNLNGNTLTIRSQKHKDKKGWKGSVVYGGGEIIWLNPIGFRVIVR